ncbi:MAG: GNAT family N-acetyltransferase [Bacilli bacterium]
MRTDLSAEKLQIYHVEELYWCIRNNEMHLSEWLHWIRYVQNVQVVETLVSSWIVLRDMVGIQESFVLKRDGIVVGMISAQYIDVNNGSCSIGCWLAQSEQGKGTMKHFLNGFLRYLFLERGMERIEFRAALENRRSNALAVSLGWSYEATLERAEKIGHSFYNVNQYGLIKESWLKNQESTLNSE